MDFIIDTDGFSVEQLRKLPKEVVSSIIDDVAHAGRVHWINLAKNDTSHLRLDYLNAIQPVDIGKNTWTVSLIGETPHLLENGAPSLDMRDTLLGPNVPTVEPGNRGKHQNAKGGYYRPIPFRHAVPDAGQVAGQAMGSAYAKKLGTEGAKKLGKSVYREAKKLKPSTTDPYGNKRKWGSKLKAGYAPKLKAHHKTDIYAGMVKQRKTYEKATQSQYMTFRTISTSVKEGWIRKPIIARNYAQDTFEFINKILPQALENYTKEVDK